MQILKQNWLGDGQYRGQVVCSEFETAYFAYFACNLRFGSLFKISAMKHSDEVWQILAF